MRNSCEIPFFYLYFSVQKHMTMKYLLNCIINDINVMHRQRKFTNSLVELLIK